MGSSKGLAKLGLEEDFTSFPFGMQVIMKEDSFCISSSMATKHTASSSPFYWNYLTLCCLSISRLDFHSCFQARLRSYRVSSCSNKYPFDYSFYILSCSSTLAWTKTLFCNISSSFFSIA